MKNCIKTSYDIVFKNYLKNRDQSRDRKYLNKINKLLKPQSKILDIGSGAGIPASHFFTKKGHIVTGIDFSKRQVQLARKKVPDAKFLIKDMLKLRPYEFKADAVISLYTIFHSPRKLHFGILKKFYTFLPNNGLLLITMGSFDKVGSYENFYGSQMYWSHYAREKNTEITKKARFKIILDEINSQDKHKHQVIIGIKKD